MKLCACGCGHTVKTEKHTYINGHNYRGKHLTEETRDKLSQLRKGESNFKVSLARKGKPQPSVRGEKNGNWNPSLHTFETRTCICGCNQTFECFINSKKLYIKGHNGKGKPNPKASLKLKGRISSMRGKNNPKLSLALTGRTLSDKHCKNISLSLIGKKKSAGFGIKISKARLGKAQPIGTNIKISKALTGKKHTSERCERRRIFMLKKWQDPLYREKTIKATFEAMRIHPNKPETVLINLLQIIDPNQWQFTGDGSVLKGYKSMDFLCESRKKIIEHYGCWTHSCPIHFPNQGCRPNDSSDRIEHFKRGGYDTLIIWEHELSDLNKVVEKVKKFYNLKGR